MALVLWLRLGSGRALRAIATLSRQIKNIITGSILIALFIVSTVKCVSAQNDFLNIYF